MRVKTGLVLCLVSGALGAGIDHYWSDLVPLVAPYLQLKSTAVQTAVPASDQKKAEEVLGDRVRCDVRFGELHLPNDEYRSFFDRCMGTAQSAAAQ
ncbi:MAG: hypothetical protein ABWZ64_05730 [Xanthobacteraceae bacterium]|jgi:hypothetical protein